MGYPMEYPMEYSPFDYPRYSPVDYSSSSLDTSLPPPLPPPLPLPTLQYSSPSSEMPRMDSGVSTEENICGSSKSFDDDDSEDSLHPRSPLKQRNSTNTKKPHVPGKSMPEKIFPITEVFNPLFLDEKKQESSSRANFATILVKNFFKREVRMTSNVNGKGEK